MERPPAGHIVEHGLYVAELDRAEFFYHRLFGARTVFGDARMRALELPGAQVLLLFRRGACATPAPAPDGGMIPGHDAQGVQHLCFAIIRVDLARWGEWLEACGVAVESRVEWPRGSTSLYFRDPDGHSLEVATPGLWPGY